MEPNLSSFFAINLYNFTFLLAARGSEGKRTTARRLEGMVPFPSRTSPSLFRTKRLPRKLEI